jgi:hypothetical protein
MTIIVETRWVDNQSFDYADPGGWPTIMPQEKVRHSL